MVDDVDDPRLEGYLPIEYFRTTDHDASSRRIRDFPSGKPRFKGNVGPAEMNFGSWPQDDFSPAQIGLITNTGYDNLPITSITVVGDWTITSDCPSSLAPGESCHVSVVFNPKREGIITGGVYINTGNSQGTEFIKLRGSGTPGDIDTPTDPDNDAIAVFTPGSLAFGSVEVSSLSASRNVVLSNEGPDRMAISYITAPAQWTQTNDCGSGLDQGESCVITLKFAPTTAGAKTGNLTVQHNGSGPKTVSMTGTGIGETTLPVISISDGEIEERTGGIPDFSTPSSSYSLGSIDFGDTGEGIFFVTGSSEGPITLTTLPSSGSGFTFAFAAASSGPFVSEATHVIATSGKLYVRARLAGAAGDYSKVVTFASAAQTSTMTITGTVEEEVVEEPEGLARIRIAGNQFYQAVNDSDLGGTLPVAGGFRLKSVNWFGGEGGNKTPNGTWAVSWTDIIDHIAEMGFNCIRLPFSGTMMTSTPSSANYDVDKNPEFTGKTSLEIFDLIINYCYTKDIYIVLDHHRRAAGDGADGAPTDGSYTKAQWKADWLTLATRWKDKTNVVGADVHNEPHDLTWTDWAPLVEEVGNYIHTQAPDWIIFCEGVGAIDSDNYWWGGQLKGVATRPISLTLSNRVAYSPHEYGQSVGSQTWLKKDSNNPVNWPLNLAAVWDAYWGYIYYNNIAPIWIGEMGGHFGLNPSTGAVDKPYQTEETAWMTQLVKYLNGDKDLNGTVTSGELPATHKGLSFAWWAFNSNSADTGGLIIDDWVTEQTGKLTLIAPLL